MATVSISIPKAARTTGSARFRVILDGAQYGMRIQFNQREGRWTLDLSDVNDSLIVAGLAMVVDWPLLRLVTDARRPPGELFVIRVDGSVAAPGLTDLGDGVELLYREGE